MAGYQQNRNYCNGCLGAVRNRTAHCAIGDRLENWKRLGDRLPVFLTEAT